MSALRRLTALEFEFDSPGEGICDFTWVYQLTNLCRLELSCDEVHIEVTIEISSLSHLTYLSYFLGDNSSLSLDVEWRLLL